MCKQHFTWRKFLKLYLEVKFYKLIISLIFCLIGKQDFTLAYWFKSVFGLAIGMGKTFTASFVALFLLIPFINRLIHSLDKAGHKWLLLALLFVYTFIGTFFNNDFFEYIGWYVTVYLLGAFIRLYETPRVQDFKFATTIAIAALLLSFVSILLITYVPQVNAHISIYYFVADSNRLLAIFSAVAFFLLFKSIDMGKSKVINMIATATFGIFLIHANSDVRLWLWEDLLRVKDYFTSEWLWLHAIGSCLAIYVVCCVIDILRQKFLEKPLFMWLDKRYPALGNKVN